ESGVINTLNQQVTDRIKLLRRLLSDLGNLEKYSTKNIEKANEFILYSGSPEAQNIFKAYPRTEKNLLSHIPIIQQQSQSAELILQAIEKMRGVIEVKISNLTQFSEAMNQLKVQVAMGDMDQKQWETLISIIERDQ
ncbi:MAG: hypothetical protein KDD40_09050, partial [Bdellovibrionales bacterium]|nr:hypothetical protein [Bdellovibrionales bacterium]